MTLDSLINAVHHMDALALMRSLPDASVQTIVTSPPYFGLRDYGAKGQIGLEPTPAAFVGKMVDLFREARRVLRDDGTLWLNLGDSYANDDKWGGTTGGKHVTALHGNGSIGREKRSTGLPPKSLLGIPWRVAFGLQDDGWILRADIIWHKPNPMPESVTDRPTKAHEYVFLFSKQTRYYYDADAIAEPVSDKWPVAANSWEDRKSRGEPSRRGQTPYASTYAPGGFAPGGNGTRNKRSVWTVPTYANPEAHFATFPPKLITPMILASAPVGGVVLDPFMGSGTTALVARQLGRNFIGCDLNPEYVAMANRRLAQPHTPDMFYTLAAAE